MSVIKAAMLLTVTAGLSALCQQPPPQDIPACGQIAWTFRERE